MSKGLLLGIILYFCLACRSSAQDSILSKPVSLTLGNVLTMQLDILACGISSGSVQASDMGPTFGPVKIEAFSSHRLRFVLMGQPDPDNTEERKRLIVTETLMLVAVQIDHFMKQNFPKLHFDVNQDLIGEWLPGADPKPKAIWRGGKVEWTK